MHIIGLVGGIASGKSAVAAELAALGATVLDADKAAHSAINLPDVQQALADRWGQAIISQSGEIDRSEVAKRVFVDTPSGFADLQFLEETLHPRIRDQFEFELSRLSDKGTAFAVIDAPLLLEAGWADLCDSVVFIDCPVELRLQRASQRGWSDSQFTGREAAQMPINLKKQHATHTIENSGSQSELASQVLILWNTLNRID